MTAQPDLNALARPASVNKFYQLTTQEQFVLVRPSHDWLAVTALQSRQADPIYWNMKAMALWPDPWRAWKMNTHHNKSLFARIGSAVDMLGSAVAAASAVQSGRVPQSRHLRTLGIDPAAFPSVGRI